MLNKKLGRVPLNGRRSGPMTSAVTRALGRQAGAVSDDDIDHPNRRVRLRASLENQFRVGSPHGAGDQGVDVLRTPEVDAARPGEREAGIGGRRFFGSSQLSVHGPTNLLAELTHKRCSRPRCGACRGARRVRGAGRSPDALWAHLPIETPEGRTSASSRRLDLRGSTSSGSPRRLPAGRRHRLGRHHLPHCARGGAGRHRPGNAEIDKRASSWPTGRGRRAGVQAGAAGGGPHIGRLSASQVGGGCLIRSSRTTTNRASWAEHAAPGSALLQPEAPPSARDGVRGGPTPGGVRLAGRRVGL